MISVTVKDIIAPCLWGRLSICLISKLISSSLSNESLNMAVTGKLSLF